VFVIMSVILFKLVCISGLLESLFELKYASVIIVDARRYVNSCSEKISVFSYVMFSRGK
jgi:hypothetical protein